MAFDAIRWNLEVIGETIKNLPEYIWEKYPTVDWKGYPGLRDVLIHQYCGVTDRIIWDIVENEHPVLERQNKAILNDIST